jgi:hypothetical protein
MNPWRLSVRRSLEYPNWLAIDFCEASGAHSTKRRRFDRDPNLRPNLRLNRSNGGLDAEDQTRERESTADSKAQQDSEKESRKSAQAERNPLDGVKRNLLRRSDWMGLTAARPLRMKFPSAEELESIGRRRKVTVKDRKRQKGMQTRNYHYVAQNTVFPLHLPQNQADDRETEGASIRFGSNIHQTQTAPMLSQPHQPASRMYHSESSESMLLDKEIPCCHQYADIGSNRKNALTTSRCSVQGSRSTGTDIPLVSLDQVRDSETFDEVKAMSESISKQSSANQQLRRPMTTNRRAANRSLASEEVRSSSVIGGRRLVQSTLSRLEGVDSYLNSEARMLRPVSGIRVPQPMPDSLSSDFLPPTRDHDYKSEEPLRNLSHSSGRVPSKSSVRLPEAQANFLPPESSHKQPHNRSKFTLELQVERAVQAAETADVLVSNKHGSSVMLSKYRDNLSTPRQHSKPTENATRATFKSADALRHGSESSVSEYSLALKTSTPGKITTEKTLRVYPGTCLSLQSSHRENGQKVVNGTIAASSTVMQPRKASQDRVWWRNNPMRQRLGMSQQREPDEDERPRNVAAQSDENQAWMRFILGGDVGSINNFYQDSEVRRQSVRDTPQRWLLQSPSDGGTLSEDRELQPIHPRNQSSRSPMQTNRTAANAVTHDMDSSAGALAMGKITPSETEFLSQLSPMAGELDERLFNPSVYTNPARTERNYIEAPSQIRGSYDNDMNRDFRRHLSTDAHDLSPAHSTKCYPLTQAPALYSSPAPSSRSVTTAIRHSTGRQPLHPIPNLFAGPKRPSSRPLQRSSRSSKTSLQNPATISHSSEQGSSRGRWIASPRSANQGSSTSRRQIHTFPMNYTPIKYFRKDQPQQHSVASRSSGSYNTLAHLDRIQNEIEKQSPDRILYSKTSSHPPSSSHISMPHPDIGNTPRRLGNFDPASNENNHGHHNDITTTSPFMQSSQDSFPPPPQPPPPSADHFTFTKPPPFLAPQLTARAPTPSFSAAHRPMRRPVTRGAAEAFSTPRPMRRRPLTPRQAAPFSTLSPVRSALRGAAIGGRSR